MKRISGRRRGEGYIDMCVGVVCFVMVLVTAINIFSFITVRTELDSIADGLIEAATYEGMFRGRFDEVNELMTEQYGAYGLECGADRYFNSLYGKVQLGEPMRVTVSKQTYIKGLGVFRIPVTVSVRKTGLSEKYWK